MLWILFLVSVLIALGVTPLTIVLSLRAHILDVPSNRSSHSRPMPRLGGLGILAGFYLAFAGLWLVEPLGFARCPVHNRDLLAVLTAGIGMAATGLYDDLYRLDPRMKFLMQLLLAVLVVSFGIRIESLSIPFRGPFVLGVFSVPLTLLWLTGFANIYNFMDGIDGLAAGTGAVYGALFALFAWIQGNQGLGAVALLLGGSSLGFLLYNLPQARTFMGDSGSLFLGMLFALFVVRLAQQSPEPASPAALILVCSVFLYDSGFTILRRIKHREDIFEAHRTHLYQRLVRVGLSHGKVTVLYLVLHGLMGVLALLYVWASELFRLCILGFASLVFLAFTLGVYWLEYRVLRSRRAGESKPHP